MGKIRVELIVFIMSFVFAAIAVLFI